jgi:hypothetical protein
MSRPGASAGGQSRERPVGKRVLERSGYHSALEKRVRKRMRAAVLIQSEPFRLWVERGQSFSITSRASANSIRSSRCHMSACIFLRRQLVVRNARLPAVGYSVPDHPRSGRQRRLQGQAGEGVSVRGHPASASIAGDERSRRQDRRPRLNLHRLLTTRGAPESVSPARHASASCSKRMRKSRAPSGALKNTPLEMRESG